jgi:two-component system, LytTR family, sensor kinase
MKLSKYKKQFIIALHLLFWFISLNAWMFIFNPGVEDRSSLSLLFWKDDIWTYLLIANAICYLYFLLPFIWLRKKTWKWVKMVFTVIFLIPIVYILYLLLSPLSVNRNYIEFYSGYFIPYIGYTVIFHIPIVAAVYFNLNTLIPRFLNKSKFIIYLLSLIALIFVTAVVDFGIFDYCIDKIFPSIYFISYFKVWELVLIVKGYLLITLLVFLIWQYYNMLVANRQKAQNELSNLKAQINPHFLFNNLNTIYSLASKNDVRTKDVILQLSDFLRYVLYDTTKETIPLEKEVEIIRKYVELQKERVDPSMTKIQFTTEGNFEKASISPLLLLPLAENCFKHGIGKKEGHITIHVGFKQKQFIFTTENTIALRERTGEEVSGGIGIRNVENRLNLLYPNRHTLHYEDVDGIFKVELIIELLK